MSSFTALMALSASKTQEQNNMAQRALLERQKKEQELRKQQADREARERELEKKLRMKHFEDEKREQERRKRMEATQKAREAALQGKRDEQRDALLYGPKKAASGKASSSSSSSGGGGGSGGTAPRERRRLPDDDADDSPSGSMLTREELRERKQQAENKRLYSSAKRPSTAHSYFKSGRKLPGGAVDIPTTQQTPGALAGKSVKDRIAAMPNSLTKLNMVKRDTRTIDEIHTELQRKKEGKVLGGDEAKSFDGWFSSTKKKDAVNKKVQQPDSTTGSGANTPTSSECIAFVLWRRLRCIDIIHRSPRAVSFQETQCSLFAIHRRGEIFRYESNDSQILISANPLVQIKQQSISGGLTR